MLGMQISVLPNIQCDLVYPGPQQPDMTSQISADSQSLISGPIWSRMHDGSGTKENMNKINTNLCKIFPCMHRAWERQTQLPTQRNDKIKFSLQQAMENFFKIRSSSLKIGCKKNIYGTSFILTISEAWWKKKIAWCLINWDDKQQWRRSLTCWDELDKKNEKKFSFHKKDNLIRNTEEKSYHKKKKYWQKKITETFKNGFSSETYSFYYIWWNFAANIFRPNNQFCLLS